MIRSLVLSACVAALVSGTALAAHAPPVLLKDVRVIDGNGGAPLEHADVLITGSKITSVTVAAAADPASNAGTSPSSAANLSPAVTPTATPTSPSAATPAAPAAVAAAPKPKRLPSNTVVLTLTGMTVMPGLISDHSHLGITRGTAASGKNITKANILRQLQQYTVYGVTTVTSLGLNRKPFYELQPQAHSGATRTADMFGADRGFGAPNSAPPASMGILDDQVYRPTTSEEARLQLHETAQRHPDLIKIWVDDMRGSLPVKMDPEIYKTLIDEAHAHGIRVAAHVYYLEDARALTSAGVDILAHGVRDTEVDERLIRSLKNRGTWYIPTLGLDESSYLFAEHPELLQQPFVRHALQPTLAAQLNDPAWRAKVLADNKTVSAQKQAVEVNKKNLKTLFDAGINIGFGTDSGATPLRIAGFAEHRELKLLTEAGLTPLQAIQMATKNAAALLHLDDRGVIAPGKLADLLIVDGDPSKDITAVDNIESVWRRGRKVSDGRALKAQSAAKPHAPQSAPAVAPSRPGAPKNAPAPVSPAAKSEAPPAHTDEPAAQPDTPAPPKAAAPSQADAPPAQPDVPQSQPAGTPPQPEASPAPTPDTPPAPTSEPPKPLNR